MVMPVLYKDHPYYELVQQVQSQDLETAYTIEFVLFNTDDEQFELPVVHIAGLDIIQEFHSRIGDMIMLIASVTRSEYTTILNYYSGLRGELQLYHTKVQPDPDETPKLFFKSTFRVMLSNYSDPSKTLEPEDILEELDPDDEDENNRGSQEPFLDLVPVHLQLVPDHIYLLPKYKFNMILRDATVDQVFWKVVDHLMDERTDGLTAYLVPPHNTHIYSNIIIPPMIDLRQVINHIQHDYGWYSKGANLYYGINDIYLFPNECPEGKSDRTVHFFKMPNGYLLGSRTMHLAKEDADFILVNQGVDIKISTVEDIEKQGNSIISVPTGKLLNDWLTHQEDRTVCDVDQIMSIDADIATGLDVETHTPTFVLDTANDYYQASKLAPLYINHGSMTIEGIPPFTLKPYQRCMYHYVNIKGDPMASSATPRGVVYQLYRTGDNLNHYSVKSQIILNIETAAVEVAVEDYI